MNNDTGAEMAVGGEWIPIEGRTPPHSIRQAHRKYPEEHGQ